MLYFNIFLLANTKKWIHSHLDVAKNPEYNTQLNFNLDHKKKHSAAEVEVKYGKDMKDKNKRVYLSTSLNRKLASWKNAQLTFKMDAQAPEHVSVVLIYSAYCI